MYNTKERGIIMKNRKNNKITLFTLFVIIITIIALIATSGTYAKYTSSVSATSSATVAKWNVTANDVNMHTGTTIEFDIFETILDSDYATGETDVQQPTAANTSSVIAPGTSGYKDLTIVNSSDVNILLDIAFEKTQSSPALPIEFAIVENPDVNTIEDADGFFNATDFASYLAGTLTDSNSATIRPTINLEVPFDTTSNEKVYRVYWRWAYSSGTAGDTSDTNFGATAQTLDPYTVSITVTATQVD